ncbi:MAG: hypothetical protein R3B13_22750 [Polyangiaceae bacterium]
MREVAGGLALLIAFASPTVARGDASSDSERIVIFVDDDDSDDDGLRDASAARLRDEALRDLWLVENPAAKPVTLSGIAARLVVEGRAASGVTRARSARLQGIARGVGELLLAGAKRRVSVLSASFLAPRGRIDPATQHAALSRTLPAPLGSGSDPDAVRVVLMGAREDLPTRVKVESVDQVGKPLDHLGEVALGSLPCPEAAGEGEACVASPWLRLTADEIDRSHPALARRSLRGEVGGRLRVSLVEGAIASVRIGGPRTSSGVLDRYRVRVRAHLVREAAGGTPPLGGTEAGARALMSAELGRASGIWGQCGVSLGAERDFDIRVVDPPRTSLVAVGCGQGLPASGGSLRIDVEGKPIAVEVEAGTTPLEAAAALARAVAAAGLTARVIPNPRAPRSALPTADVSVTGRDGKPAEVGGEALSTDRTLAVCLGRVDLSDGLSHFSDFDAVSGTVEERALIRALADDDPASIELVVVPSFAGSGRIGESFIYADGGSIRNVIIIDRAAIVAGARSHTVAHELGHILLDMPGHPDDYGVDHPGDLMDADAAEPSLFGPRRLSVAECERAVRQSGPSAPLPLMTHWPLVRPR